MELVRCSRRNTKGYGCQNRFPIEFRMQKGQPVQILRCPECRSKHSAQQKKESTKAVAKQWRSSANGKAHMKRQNSSTMSKIKHALKEIVKNNGGWSPQRRKVDHLSEFTTIPSGPALVRHLESTFDQSWMSWSNYGIYDGVQIEYKKRWNIGHIIPCEQYNPDIVEDLKKCFSLKNIFAQDARENCELHSQLPDAETLMAIQELWPARWQGQLPGGVQGQ